MASYIGQLPPDGWRQRCIGPIIGQQCRQSASGGSIFGSYLAAIAYNKDSPHCPAARGEILWRKILLGRTSAVVPSCVFAGVGGYYASKQSGLAGVFRRAADGSDWKHALSEIEAFTVFVHPRDPYLVFAGTADGSKHRSRPKFPPRRLSRPQRASLVIPAG